VDAGGQRRQHTEVMHPVVLVIAIGWVVFWVAWLVAAFTAKASRGRWGRLAGARIGLVVVRGLAGLSSPIPRVTNSAWNTRGSEAESPGG
jgi:hypothetical protein